ncbi:MAG TPA: carboxypeptidase-like regulatory domain-containing protein [Pseudacidobacterium sp.]|jgi:hypothetical protein|nr:carboxypeptidase-like regulatory domain-containing protein [Pseudacidobacterium sp.]
MNIKRILYSLIICVSASIAAAQIVSAPAAQTGTIIGTVLDVNSGMVPGATIVLEGSSESDHQSIAANDNGFFQLNHVNPGTPYHVTISADGFANWTSPEIILKPGQYFELTDIRLKVATAVTTITAAISTEEIAREQVKIAEQQRVLGFIPNFYVVYDKNPVPLPAKLKFRLAIKTSTDPVTFLGAAFISATDQAGGTPDYQQGLKGYGQRFGANYANGLTDIMIGGAILPSLLHQDPRYFYQGTGTTKSRTLHALSSPFICKGDNGHWQPNYSGLGGYLASGAIANTYYPTSNRGPGLVFSTFGVNIAADMANGVLQEFVLRRLTPGAKNRP